MDLPRGAPDEGSTGFRQHLRARSGALSGVLLRPRDAARSTITEATCAAGDAAIFLADGRRIGLSFVEVGPPSPCTRSDRAIAPHPLPCRHLRARQRYGPCPGGGPSTGAVSVAKLSSSSASVSSNSSSAVACASTNRQPRHT